MVWHWFDLFTFIGDGQVECPDCPAQSPECRDVYELAAWVADHVRNCPA